MSPWSKAGWFGALEPVAYGKLQKRATCQGLGREGISPAERELVIHLLAREGLAAKEPFGDTAADLKNKVPKPGWVGKGRSQSKEKTLRWQHECVCGLAKCDCCLVVSWFLNRWK